MVEIFEGLIIGIGSAVAGSVITHVFEGRRTKRDAVDWHLDRFPEAGKDFVGVWNSGSKIIDGCQVFCDDVECVWWDNHKTGPRAIHLGGGINATLPANHEPNPLIEVKSKNKKPQTVKFLEITLRAGY